MNVLFLQLMLQSFDEFAINARKLISKSISFIKKEKEEEEKGAKEKELFNMHLTRFNK